MENIGIVLTVAFALQRFVELIIDPLVENFFPANKKTILTILALMLGELIAFTTTLTIFPEKIDLGDWEKIITGFAISGGTEFLNSFIKVMGYKKEEEKRRFTENQNK